MSSKVKGRFWAKAENEANRIRAMSRRRDMRSSPAAQEADEQRGQSLP